MPNQWLRNWSYVPTGLRFLVVTLLALGLFFRFVNLDRKLYWNDETYTSFRVAGYTQTEIVQAVTDRIISVQDLQKYQRINPERNAIDTVKSLAIEDPHHPPLYYIMARFWMPWFDNPVVGTRSLSALISLLVFPCLYFLCRELFASSLTGWIAIVLIAVSPFHVVYAQEAREYSLWTVTILLSSTALLKAMRLQTILSWGIYAITLGLGFYTHLFFGFIAIGHGIYLAVIEKFRFNQVLTSYLFASVAGLLSFAPWLIVIVNNFSTLQSETDWTERAWTLSALVERWMRDLSFVFVDLQFRYGLLRRFLAPLVLILAIYATYFLCRKSSKQVWLFILSLIAVTGLALILPDVILGGQRSISGRYLVPSYLGIQLAVAYLFAAKITAASTQIWQQRLWQLLLILIISGGVLSCAVSSQAQVWWNKPKVADNPRLTKMINQAERPLVISDRSLPTMLSLSYLLDPDVKLQLLAESKPSQMPNNFSDIFLFRPSDPMRKTIQQSRKIELVDQHGQLWRVVK